MALGNIRPGLVDLLRRLGIRQQVERVWGIWLFVHGVTLREQHEAFSQGSATPRCSSAKRRASRSGRNRPPGPADPGHLVPMTAYLDQITSIVAATEKVLG